MQQHLLLKLEYNTEKQAYQQQTEAIGIRRKVKRGDAWANIRVGKSFYNSLNQICVEIFRTEDQDIEHNFEYGRPVAFFRTVPKEDSKDKVEVKFLNITGTVSFVDGDRMVVSLPEWWLLCQRMTMFSNCNQPVLPFANQSPPLRGI